MFLPCPFCGEREISEFDCRGEALPQRPDPTEPDALSRFHDYYYLRSNPAGLVREHWYHTAGCLNWLEVRRDTRTHVILDVFSRASAFE
jgi:heterotetrameric sarcosine oxidase delta subunit